MKLCQEGIDNLRCAIVKLAAEDYLELKKRIYKIDHYGRVYTGNTREDFVYELKRIERFFGNEWYVQLCDIESAKLIVMLDAEFEEWKAKYDRRKSKAG